MNRNQSSVESHSGRCTVLYLIDNFCSVGGTERHLLQLTTLLDRSRFRPLVLVFDLRDNHLIRAMREGDVPVIDFPVGRYYTPRAARKAIDLSRLIRKHKVDIVQTYHFKSDTYGVAVARLSGVKHIISSRRDLGDLKSPWHLFLNRRLDRLIDGFIVVADAVGRVVQEREGVPRLRLRTIYNGVDTVRFSPPNADEARQARERLGFRPEDVVVGTAAWFRPEKNHLLLLEVLESLQSDFPALRLLWMGDGPMAGRLRAEARRRDLEAKVLFAGEQEDIRDCLRSCDVGCIVPSGNEGFSNAVLEKMAMGLPMVVTDVGGNAESVVHGENGFIVGPHDATGLASRLAELCSNPDLRVKMGKNARERVESLFSIGDMVRRHEKYYEQLLAGTHQSA